MFFNLKIVKIDIDYCNYLRKFDKRVPINYAKKVNRPFIGVLFNIGNIEYFAPLTSPKNKHLTMHNTIDFLKIRNGELGAINFNNMIPVTNDNYEIINLYDKTYGDQKYLSLLNDQLNWLNLHKIQLIFKADNLYALYLAKLLPPNIYDRCCDFKLLEKICYEYNQIRIKN